MRFRETGAELQEHALEWLFYAVLAIIASAAAIVISHSWWAVAAFVIACGAWLVAARAWRRGRRRAHQEREALRDEWRL